MRLTFTFVERITVPERKNCVRKKLVGRFKIKVAHILSLFKLGDTE